MDFSTFVLAASMTSLDNLPTSVNQADAIEFRMDLSLDPLAELSQYSLDIPIIATNRVAHEGGNYPENDSRIDLLCAAMSNPSVKAIDVEFSSITSGHGQRAIDHARKHDISTIISTHNFNSTPSLLELESILTESTKIGDVGKLSVTAESPSDITNLLVATWNQTQSGNLVATMSMGTLGSHSRVIAPFYGSKIGYAPLDLNTTTAPGQYSLESLRNLIKSLS
ncbi:MAG TPA: type I 3-dehydroquinate dehydratase [Halobacteriales archaeon]|nr:type I 3-dehydroquinate dehydratase [Halobacteriales archaeon]|tara:strand:- start:79754 stop:80425 length:672 start_codon:yes stop_codon:yes gene_type:complete